MAPKTQNSAKDNSSATTLTGPGYSTYHDDWLKMPKEEQDKFLNSLNQAEQEEFATKMGWYGHATSVFGPSENWKHPLDEGESIFLTQCRS